MRSAARNNVALFVFIPRGLLPAEPSFAQVREFFARVRDRSYLRQKFPEQDMNDRGDEDELGYRTATSETSA